MLNSVDERERSTILGYAFALIALLAVVGLAVFGVLYLGAALADATRSAFVAGLMLLLIVSAVSNVVFAAHRGRAAAATAREFWQDLALSNAMVIGGLSMSHLASFAISGLLLSMAGHQLLPGGLSNAMLEARPQVFTLVWLALQPGWMLAMMASVCRHGVARAVEAFRFATFSGLLSVGLSFVCMVALLALGPSPR